MKAKFVKILTVKSSLNLGEKPQTVAGLITVEQKSFS